MDLNPLDLLFTIEKGRVNVKPFKLKTEYVSADLGGWTSFDQSINYVMNLEVPRELFGSEANAALDDMLSKANVAGTKLLVGENS